MPDHRDSHADTECAGICPQYASSIVRRSVYRHKVFEWVEAKSRRNLAERDFDFECAARICQGDLLEYEVRRHGWGEQRIVAIGEVEGEILFVVYTWRVAGSFRPVAPAGGSLMLIVRRSTKQIREHGGTSIGACPQDHRASTCSSDRGRCECSGDDRGGPSPREARVQSPCRM